MTEDRGKENRWDVAAMRCMDCGALFTPGRVDRSLPRPLGEGNVCVVVWMPETCPACHNLTDASKGDRRE